METYVRWAGACWIFAGVLGLAGLAHPDSFDIGFAESSRQALWPAVHVTAVIALILTLFGLAGLAVRHGAAWGRLGMLGTVLAVPGIAAAAGLFLTEALVFPVLAREDPALLDLDGALLGSLPLRLAGGFILLFFVGMVIVGAAVERARVLPRGTGMVLAVATVLLAALAGPFVPVAGKVAGLIFSSAQAWLGWSLLTSVGSGTPRVPDRPLASEP